MASEYARASCAWSFSWANPRNGEVWPEGSWTYPSLPPSGVPVSPPPVAETCGIAQESPASLDNCEPIGIFLVTTKMWNFFCEKSIKETYEILRPYKNRLHAEDQRHHTVED